MNKEYIAANLCENRSKPVLKCAGKCQLAKQLAEEENSPAPSKNNIKFQEVTYSQHEAINPISTIDCQRVGHIASYTMRIVSEPYFPIFHPPA